MSCIIDGEKLFCTPQPVTSGWKPAKLEFKTIGKVVLCFTLHGVQEVWKCVKCSVFKHIKNMERFWRI